MTATDQRRGRGGGDAETRLGAKIGGLGSAVGGAVAKLLTAMKLWTILGWTCGGEFCCPSQWG